MRAIGMALLATSLSIAIPVHAAPRAGLWRITVHDRYFNDTYTTCQTQARGDAWLPHNPGEHCHTVSWRETGQIAQGREVCSGPVIGHTPLVVDTAIRLRFGPRRQSYSGSLVTRTQTPVGTMRATETVSARWLSPVCKAQ